MVEEYGSGAWLREGDRCGGLSLLPCGGAIFDHFMTTGKVDVRKYVLNTAQEAASFVSRLVFSKNINHVAADEVFLLMSV